MEPISLPGIESFGTVPEIEYPPIEVFQRPLTRFIPREFSWDKFEHPKKVVTFLIKECTNNRAKVYQCPKCGKRLHSAGRARSHSERSHGYKVYFSKPAQVYFDGNDIVKVGAPLFSSSPDTLLNNDELRTLH